MMNENDPSAALLPADPSAAVTTEALPHGGPFAVEIATLARAHRELCDAVQRQWDGGHALKMSIPARIDHDTDLIIGEALRLAMRTLVAIGSGNQSNSEASASLHRSAAKE